MNTPLFVVRRRSLAGLAAVVAWFAATPGVQAQPTVTPGVDQTPTRVLQIEQVLGNVSVQRGGRTEELRPGFLVFNEEKVLLSSRSRADLALSRYGEVDIASSGDGPGALSFEKLPFSSWAVDLETRLRLERGLLRVRWSRGGDSDWPLAVVIDRWSAQLGNGEFLFRRDERGTLVCNVAGIVEISDEPAGKRQALNPGTCAQVIPGETAKNAKLEPADWSELQLAILPQDNAAVASSRSLAVPALPPSTKKSSRERIVTPPPAAPVDDSDVAIITETAPPPVATIPGPADSVAIADVAPLSSPSLSLPEPPPAPVVQAPPVQPPVVSVPKAVEKPSIPAPAPVQPEVKSGPVVSAPVAPVVTPPVTAASAAVPAAPPVVATVPTAEAARTPEPAPSKPEEPTYQTPVAAAPPVSLQPLAEVPIPATAPPVAAPAPGSAAPAAGKAGTTTVAKAPPATMPLNAGAPPETGGPEWIVNVMTVTDPEVAKQHLTTLTDAGYPAILRTEMIRGRSSYRIIIGGIGNEQGARRTAQLLASKLGYTAAWPLQKR